MFQKYLTVVLDEFGEASEIFIKIPFLRIVAPHLSPLSISFKKFTQFLLRYAGYRSSMSNSSSFEQRVIDAIQTGSLPNLKRCCIGRNDINRPISVSKDIPVSCKSPTRPFPTIRAPTPLIYSILCEQPDLFSYMLTSKTPDLSIRVNGWTPLHYAAITESHKCLEILLKYKYIQENIDLPVEDSGVPNASGRGATALHIAASNRRHAAVLLLTQTLPPIEFDGHGVKIEIRSPNDPIYEPANALGVTAHGNMPIHIAARLGDWDLCQIILHATEDPTVRNTAGKTPAEIAREYRYDRLASQLEGNDVEPIENLRLRYLADEERKIEKGKAVEVEELDAEWATVEEVRTLRRVILELTHAVKELTVRVDALDAAQPPALRLVEVDVIHCKGCGMVGRTEKCHDCGFDYCRTCWLKPCHPCSQP
jgi:hypothetical protein